MATADSDLFSSFSLPEGALKLEYTLTNGQMFRWRKTPDGWWDAVSGNKLLRIREMSQDGDEAIFAYQTFPHAEDLNLVRRFLRLDVDLQALYESWRASDEYLGSLADRFAGLRLVLQEPEECLLSFICSTANFIPRIMKA